MWTDLEDIIILSGRTQAQNGKCCRILCIRGHKVVKFTETERGMVGAKGWGRRKGLSDPCWTSQAWSFNSGQSPGECPPASEGPRVRADP